MNSPAIDLYLKKGVDITKEYLEIALSSQHSNGGISVNSYWESSIKGLFAIGECALFEDMIYGLIAPGYEMAEVLTANLCAHQKSFKSFDMSTKLKLIGIDVASFGDPFINEPDCRTIAFENKHKGIYKRINMKRVFVLTVALLVSTTMFAQKRDIMLNESFATNNNAS